MSKKTDEKAAEVAKWYYYNRGLTPRDDLRKRIEFLETALHNVLYLLTYFMEDLQEIEGRNKGLYIPNGFEIKGDLKRFG